MPSEGNFFQEVSLQRPFPAKEYEKMDKLRGRCIEINGLTGSWVLGNNNNESEPFTTEPTLYKRHS